MQIYQWISGRYLFDIINFQHIFKSHPYHRHQRKPYRLEEILSIHHSQLLNTKYASNALFTIVNCRPDTQIDAPSDANEQAQRQTSVLVCREWSTRSILHQNTQSRCKKDHRPRQYKERRIGPVQERKKLKIILPDGSRNEMLVEDTTIEDVLRRLGINPVEVIVAKNGKIVSEEETADSKDELKIVRVVHGG